MITHELDEEHKKIISRCWPCGKYPFWEVWDVGETHKEITLRCVGGGYDIAVSHSTQKGKVIRLWNDYMEFLKKEGSPKTAMKINLYAGAKNEFT